MSKTIVNTPYCSPPHFVSRRSVLQHTLMTKPDFDAAIPASAPPPPGTRVGSVDIGAPIRGQWARKGLGDWSTLFAIDARPSQLHEACTKRIQSIPDAARVVDIHATGAHPDDPYAYELWHRAPSVPGKPIERIVAFGDSLTDKGNMHLASAKVLTYSPVGTSLPSASWFNGRFSNGPTWVEYLASRNGLVLNSWAVGGAQTRDVQLVPALRAMRIHGVGRQIDRFMAHAARLPDYDISRTLFTFLAAGNDFVNDSKTGPEIIAQQEADLKKLVAFGARKIIVVNLPDVSVAPVFRMGRTDAHTVLGKVEYYNAHITEVARRVAAASGAQIRVVDVRTSFDEVMARKEKFGFTNVTDSCLDINKDSSVTYLKTQKIRATCNPDTFVFWDSLHPTTRMHSLMADWVVESAPREWNLR